MSNNQDPEDNNKSDELDYLSAGVDIEAGNSLVSEIAKITKGTSRPKSYPVLAGLEHFVKYPKTISIPS